MIRIERTNLNLSALITLSSRLKKIKLPYYLNIETEGQTVKIEKIEKKEPEDFQIDLTELDSIVDSLFVGPFKPVLLENQREKYFRNCSFALYFYLKESNNWKDHHNFEAFHRMQFGVRNHENFIGDILKAFCCLFQIDESTVNKCFESNTEFFIYQIGNPNSFYSVFKSLIYKENDQIEIAFESEKSKEKDRPLDALFLLKNLLFCFGYNVSLIPESNQFSIINTEQVEFDFLEDFKPAVKISFRYDYIKILFKFNKDDWKGIY